MTPEQLVELLAIILALVFGYFPKIKEWFDSIKPVWKPLLNAGLLLALALALVGISCLNFIVYFDCSMDGVEVAVGIWWKAILLNQFTYAIAVNYPKKLRGA